MIPQDRIVQRKSKASWTCCIGEIKTCCEKEKDGGHAIETLVSSRLVIKILKCIYTERKFVPRNRLPDSKPDERRWYSGRIKTCKLR